MKLFLGIDGGGTNTRALICDSEGNALATGEAAGANHNYVGWKIAEENVVSAIAKARENARIAAEPFAGVFLGIAGAGGSEAQERWRNIALQRGLAAEAKRIGVDHDLRIALAGGLAGAPGIALIAGTGSACYGRTASGAAWRAGGWGALVDDCGSGYWIGTQAIIAAIRARDGRAGATELTDFVPKFFKCDSLEETLRKLRSGALDRPTLASIATDVINAADGGDAASEQILKTGAFELALMAKAVAEKLLIYAPQIVLAGGAAEAVTYRREISESLQLLVPNSQLVPTALPPVAGAALLAREIAES